MCDGCWEIISNIKAKPRHVLEKILRDELDLKLIGDQVG